MIIAILNRMHTNENEKTHLYVHIFILYVKGNPICIVDVAIKQMK